MRGWALPRFPIESLLGQIEGRRIFPRAGGIVAAEGALDHHEIGDSALRVEVFGLFAVDVFAGMDGIDDDLLVPMVGDSRDQAIDFLVVEEVFVAAGYEEIGIADDFAGEGVAAVVEVGGGDALRAWELHGGGEQAGALHADADNAEAQAVAGGNCGIAGGFEARVSQEKCVGGGEGAGGSGSALQEFAAREIFFHFFSRLKKIECQNQRNGGDEVYAGSTGAQYIAPLHLLQRLQRYFLEEDDVVVAVILQAHVAFVGTAAALRLEVKLFLGNGLALGVGGDFYG